MNTELFAQLGPNSTRINFVFICFGTSLFVERVNSLTNFEQKQLKVRGVASFKQTWACVLEKLVVFKDFLL